MEPVSFKRQLIQDFQAVEENMWGILHGALRLTFQDMVKKCPVDTGYLRMNLYLQSQPKKEVALARDRDPKMRYPEPAMPKLRKAKTYTFGDTAEYADMIEYHGHSGQAPNGFMRPALANFKIYLQELRRKAGLRKRKWVDAEAFEDLL